MSHRLRFCTECPDHEACATGTPCHEVRDVNEALPLADQMVNHDEVEKHRVRHALRKLREEVGQ